MPACRTRTTRPGVWRLLRRRRKRPAAVALTRTAPFCSAAFSLDWPALLSAAVFLYLPLVQQIRTVFCPSARIQCSRTLVKESRRTNPNRTAGDFFSPVRGGSAAVEGESRRERVGPPRFQRDLALFFRRALVVGQPAPSLVLVVPPPTLNPPFFPLALLLPLAATLLPLVTFSNLRYSKPVVIHPRRSESG